MGGGGKYQNKYPPLGFCGKQWTQGHLGRRKWKVEKKWEWLSFRGKQGWGGGDMETRRSGHKGIGQTNGKSSWGPIKEETHSGETVGCLQPNKATGGTRIKYGKTSTKGNEKLWRGPFKF